MSDIGFVGNVRARARVRPARRKVNVWMGILKLFGQLFKRDLDSQINYDGNKTSTTLSYPLLLPFSFCFVVATILLL
jgi:hypothetical protein